ncbi:MAG TPA: nicotinate-nucleotide adenylyltransferase [Lachnospiraceae bacterium]|nr:nicotinate-nucleotide adenylyltransferase [Lachnospiraceae bacterium]
MKTGILGGTFDPIHIGHLLLAEAAYEAAGLDRVILLPTGRSYFKDGTGVTDAGRRLAMVRLAAQGNRHLEVLDIEVRRPGKTYTSDTLQELSKCFPEDELFYIIGADTLLQMEHWHQPEIVFQLARILVETRSDEAGSGEVEITARSLREKYGADIRMLPVRNIEISSTEIRCRVREGRSIRYLVPRNVEDYIEEQGLYLAKTM